MAAIAVQLGRSGEQGRLHQAKYLFLYYVSSIGRQQICSAQSRFPFEKIEIQALLALLMRMLHSMVGRPAWHYDAPVRKSSPESFFMVGDAGLQPVEETFFFELG